MKCYEGSEPYIVLSYAHKNTDMVMPVFRGFYENGFRIWYDAGIEAGSEWPEYIAEHLEKASCCICFLTQGFLDSDNCRQELNFALSEHIPVLVIYMEDVKLTAGMKMRLGLTQALYRNRHDTEASFLRELYAAKMLEPCRKISADNEPKQPAVVKKYSEGLQFRELNDGTYAVAGIGSCKDTELKIPPTTPDGGRVTVIVYSAFEDCSSLTTITIPDSVTEIGGWAFGGCSSLTTITIPDSVTEIGERAFEGCSSLTTITIPDSVTEIGEEAFLDCSSLTTITIPDSVTKIGYNAFEGCSSLTTIYCEAPSRPSTWDKDWNPDNCPVVWGYKPQ